MRPMLTHDRPAMLAREAIILLGFLLLAATLWSGATLTGRPGPAVSGGDARPVEQWHAAVSAPSTPHY